MTRFAILLLLLMASGCSLLEPLGDYDSAYGKDAATGDPCAPRTRPRTSAFHDDFNNDKADPAWQANCGAIQMGGEAIFRPSGMVGGYCFYSNSTGSDFGCDAIQFKVPQTTHQVYGVQTFVYIDNQDTGGGRVMLLQEQGTFNMTSVMFNTLFPIDQGGKYDPVQDLWWRFSSTTDSITFETSPDGVNFRVRGQGKMPIPIRNVVFSFGAGTWANVADPGEAHLDCWNVPAPCP
jgi:hypothetical protein